MRAGALRNIITFERNAGHKADGFNEVEPKWITWGDAFCEKTSRRGTEHFDPTTKQRFPQVVYRFRCRHTDVEGIDPTMRIDHEGQKYNIRVILPDDQRRDDVIIEATLQDGSI